MINHIHIGAGALGLGLIVPELARVAGRSIILNRAQQADDVSVDKCSILRNNKKYTICSQDSDFEQRIEDFVFLEDDLPSDLNGRYCIITTSVKEGVQDAGFLVALKDIIECCAERHENVLVMACENTTRSEDLETLIDDFIDHDEYNGLENPWDGVYFRNVLVDRVCKNVRVANGDILVDIEIATKFWIEEDDITRAFFSQGHRTTNGLKLIDKDRLDKEYIKKIVLFNLSHALISVWALKDNFAYLDIYLRESDDGKHILRDILSEIIDLLVFKFPHLSKDELLAYSDEVMDRFSQIRDPLGRIIRRFRGPETLESFFKDIWLKGLQYFGEIGTRDFVAFPVIAATLFQIPGLIAVQNYVVATD